MLLDFLKILGLFFLLILRTPGILHHHQINQVLIHNSFGFLVHSRRLNLVPIQVFL